MKYNQNVKQEKFRSGDFFSAEDSFAFGTQKALQKLVDMRGEKQYNEANKEWLLTPITLAEGGLRKCGYFMQ